MPAVEVLPDDLVNQIAAGEVIERPASVVKELAENALDAGATRIEVAIAQGGMRWICVTDDGEGLEPRDAELAFRRHATSKIRSSEDLAKVSSLGFRGEALPSIAGVASVRMRTRCADRALGVEVAGEGRGIGLIGEVSCPAGTRVEVDELFARVPARRKFLKTALTEGTHVLRCLERLALARPDVYLSLERDGRRALVFAPTADPRERAISVLPASVGEHLVEVRGRRDGAELRGYATPTHVLRGSTGDIHLLVNARPVRDRLLLHAVRQAYQDALPPGRHPAAVLYLSIEPGEIDVNVHPAKAEVRFRDPGAVTRLVRDALVQALGLRSRAPAPPATGYLGGPSAPLGVGERRPPADLELFGRGPGQSAFAGVDPSGPPPLPFARHRYLGQVFGTYLVLSAEETLLLLDQHAAHERVLFERLRQSLLGGELERQALLAPVFVELSRASADALEAHAGELKRAGFELEPAPGAVRGGVRVGVRAVPVILATGRAPDWQQLLEETAAALVAPDPEGARDGIDAALHGTLATAACHAAVRKGDLLDPREVQGLLEALDETVWFPNCPHGRPIASQISAEELERRFLRR